MNGASETVFPVASSCSARRPSHEEGPTQAIWIRSYRSQRPDRWWTVSTVRVSHGYLCRPSSSHIHHSLLGKMLVVLRDGRKLQGVLRSYDQFGACSSVRLLNSHVLSLADDTPVG